MVYRFETEGRREASALVNPLGHIGITSVQESVVGARHCFARTEVRIRDVLVC
jgi:hypothetical protein